MISLVEARLGTRPSENRKEGLGDRLGGSVLRTQNAGMLLIGP